MTTTTTIGTWYNAVGGQTLDGPFGYVTDSLGDFGGDYDIDRLTEAFVEAIRKQLPAGVYLAGDQIIADVDYAGDPIQDVRDAVETTDLYALAEWHVLGRKVGLTAVTQGQLIEAQGGHSPVPNPSPVTVQCPVEYDFAAITAGDILHDDQIVVL